MRIAILADPIDLQHAGIHQYTKQLVEALAAHDQENEYVLIRQKEGDTPMGMLQQVVTGPFGQNFNFLRMLIGIPKAIRRLKIDVVLSPSHFGAFSIPRGVKRVMVIHDLTPLLLPETHPRQRVIIHRLLMGQALRNADITLTNSSWTKNDVLRMFPTSHAKVKTIPLGRDMFFKPVLIPRELERWHIRKPYFLNVGTIEPRKNLVILLKAYSLFRKQGGQGQLVIVGEMGWKTQAFQKELQAHHFRSDIVLTGFITKESLRALYGSALAFIYPSLYEGFGIPLLEAMSCQVPVITSNSSSLTEVGGLATLKFEPTNSEELAHIMVQVSIDPILRNKMIKQGIEQVKKFSWQHYAETFQVLLKSMTGEANGQ